VDVLVVDDTGFGKDGSASPCVARQYSGTLGKIGNCRAGVSAGRGPGAAAFGVPLAVWLMVPLFGMIIGTVKVSAVLVVVFTALYRSDRVSDRTFRLLRWSLNRPEPSLGNSGAIKEEEPVSDTWSTR
jgi:hypothetical protein